MSPTPDARPDAAGRPDAVSSGGRPYAVADHVSRRFASPDGDVVALDDVTAAAPSGGLTVIAGRSGSGKSTLLGLFAALDRPDTGEILVDGRRISGESTRQRRRWRRDHLGIVLAQPSDNLTARFDAAGNVAWARALRRPRRRDAAVRPTVASEDDALFELLGLGGLDRAAIHELSMGQQMRLAFACAIVGDPRLVVADEPTASLDAEAAAVLVSSLRSLTGSGTTLIVATHDPALIDVADHLVRLDEGRRVA